MITNDFTVLAKSDNPKDNLPYILSKPFSQCSPHVRLPRVHVAYLLEDTRRKCAVIVHGRDTEVLVDHPVYILLPGTTLGLITTVCMVGNHFKVTHVVLTVIELDGYFLKRNQLCLHPYVNGWNLFFCKGR